MKNAPWSTVLLLELKKELHRVKFVVEINQSYISRKGDTFSTSNSLLGEEEAPTCILNFAAYRCLLSLNNLDSDIVLQGTHSLIKLSNNSTPVLITLTSI